MIVPWEDFLPQLTLIIELQEIVYTIEDGKRRCIQLDSYTYEESGQEDCKQCDIVFTSKNDDTSVVRVTFIGRIVLNHDYSTMNLVQVDVSPTLTSSSSKDECSREHATKLKLIWKDESIRLFPLKAETLLGGTPGNGIVFSNLLNRKMDGNFSTSRCDHQSEFGGVALWKDKSESDQDEILYNVWVNEKLPHPKILEQDETWTVPRAKQFVDEYIAKFRRYGEVYINGENLDELKQCVDHAKKIHMTSVYMHINTWGGRYQPFDKETYDLNPKIFPNGWDDFKELKTYAESKGIGVAIRTLSHSISLKNPKYCSKIPDDRLSHFWRGTLVNEIGPNTTEIIIQSDKTLPTSYGSRFFGARPNPGTHRNWVHINNEILQYDGYIENKENGTITLKVAVGAKQKPIRGYGWTSAAAHYPGAPVKILVGLFKDKVSADPDTTMMDAVAERYAEFNNTMCLSNSNFDGIELYITCTAYGETVLPGLVYSKIDHPVACFTSNGPPKWGYFEQRMARVRKELGLDKPSRIPARMTFMIGLHQDHWLAPSPYGFTYSIVPNAVLGYYRCNIQAQNSFHELTVDVFKMNGLLDFYASSIQQWRKYGTNLSDKTKKRILSSYPTQGWGGWQYPLQDEHFRFEAATVKNASDSLLEVIPFRPMRREGKDRGWGYIQEHGPIYTYQYMRPNTSGFLQMKNPYHEQVPEITIRVMKDFNRTMLSRSTDNDKSAIDLDLRMHDTLEGSNLSIKDDLEWTLAPGNYNHDIMIPLDPDQKGLDSGQMELTTSSSGATITFDNTNSPDEKAFDIEKRKTLISYRVKNVNIQNAKGLGMIITGDGSDALFVVRICGCGTRDFVVPIDFVGKRYIEIPDPQVSWSVARWPISKAWKRWSPGESSVTSVYVGLVTIPAKTRSSVFVERMQFLPEKISMLKNPVIKCGKGSISITGDVHSDSYIWYKGGDKAKVYDLNWNEKDELPAEVIDAKVAPGLSDISIENHNGEDGDPWLECQFFVKDTAIETVWTQSGS
eukprot:CAMPEP_0195287524 /NCGR_PEP_ID=MMETSP0707-20130614/4546_1 /TAXON_ID=33640 /ORGANISM="Asterionellopsis glacialis, Strain CCMP134" /LENGTH=1015 /DNA_ID=CAMNT_0040347285 /DNA_START=99 /DNA_END=3146 /DNA_ORIENTATION=+